MEHFTKGVSAISLIGSGVSIKCLHSNSCKFYMRESFKIHI